jgi:phosphonate transport system ATP-binding protein
MALAHFPRIVGLRDGQVAFDLPTSAVTRERLERLYAQHEHELQGGDAVAADAPPPQTAPVVMHCR